MDAIIRNFIQISHILLSLFYGIITAFPVAFIVLFFISILSAWSRDVAVFGGIGPVAPYLTPIAAFPVGIAQAALCYALLRNWPPYGYVLSALKSPLFTTGLIWVVGTFLASIWINYTFFYQGSFAKRYAQDPLALDLYRGRSISRFEKDMRAHIESAIAGDIAWGEAIGTDASFSDFVTTSLLIQAAADGRNADNFRRLIQAFKTYAPEPRDRYYADFFSTAVSWRNTDLLKIVMKEINIRYGRGAFYNSIFSFPKIEYVKLFVENNINLNRLYKIKNRKGNYTYNPILLQILDRFHLRENSLGKKDLHYLETITLMVEGGANLCLKDSDGFGLRDMLQRFSSWRDNNDPKVQVVIRTIDMLEVEHRKQCEPDGKGMLPDISEYFTPGDPSSMLDAAYLRARGLKAIGFPDAIDPDKAREIFAGASEDVYLIAALPERDIWTVFCQGGFDDCWDMYRNDSNFINTVFVVPSKTLMLWLGEGRDFSVYFGSAQTITTIREQHFPNIVKDGKETIENGSLSEQLQETQRDRFFRYNIY